MKLRTLLASLLFGAIATATFAQTPSAAPAGTTGICNDGSFTSVDKKSGACSGHKGIKTWMGPAATTAPVADKPALPTGSTSKSSGDTLSPVKPAAGGPEAMAVGAGQDKVWVNTASKVYHCPGTKYYGKTKKGSYMSEADATAAGNHADHKKVCKK